MEDHLGLFLDYLSVEKGLSKNTLSAYQRDLKSYLAFLKKSKIKSLETVSRKHIMEYLLAERDRGLNPSSVSRGLVAIRMFHRFLAEEGKIREDVTQALESPKLFKHLPEALNVAEVESLIASPNVRKAQGMRDHAVLELMYATGLRASEVTGLKTGHLNFETGVIRIFGKGEKERVVPMGQASQKSLKRYLEKARPVWTKGGAEDALFVSKLGKRMSRQTVWGILKKYAKLAGVRKKIYPH
ncbi:MAG TPA: tyrosine-type recombinase/integrase, partial [Candidatus Omnitrophota bacterium]|nr:tyrosine-type recombinase/integrase [Candidatus Omnitrophota bacterium]